MNIFTIKNSDFLNEFYYKLIDYTYNTFNSINHSIIEDKNNFFKHFFTSDEITGMVLLNKNIFQNIVGFYELVDLKLPVPAFSSLRSSIECIRLFRLYYTNEEFRKDYLLNSNLDFSKVRDYNFSQAKIVKKLDEMEDELRSQDRIPLSMVLFNHTLTKGSAISELHSELSKWSHSLNINLLKIYTINDNRIYLGIEDEYKENMQHIIRKYIEGSFIIINTHRELFCNIHFDKEFYTEFKEMMELYKKYIKIFYNQ